MVKAPALRSLPLLAPELRRHTALVRALLDELDRLVPLPSSARDDAIAEQLTDELRGLACRILECTETRVHDSDASTEVAAEPSHTRLAKTRAPESVLGFAQPSRIRLARSDDGE